MDIYSIINSKAISEYCRSIKHSFSSIEMAYLVYANTTMTIAEKHLAYKEVINTQPDMAVEERTWTPYFESLHTFLRRYMDIQNKYLGGFYREDPNSIYSFEVWYSADEEYVKDNRIFPNFALCYASLKAEIDEMLDFYKDSDKEMFVRDIRVTKQWINMKRDEQAKRIVVCIDYDNNPTEFYETYNIISDEDRDVFCAFEGMCFEIPTPFKKGDILIEKEWKKDGNKPFILDWLPFWNENGEQSNLIEHLRKNGDSSDLITGIFGQASDGTIWCDHGPSYLDLEYCERKLVGREKILLALSNYIKGEIPLHIFIKAYDVHKAEHYASEERAYADSYILEYLDKSGLN